MKQIAPALCGLSLLLALTGCGGQQTAATRADATGGTRTVESVLDERTAAAAPEAPVTDTPATDTPAADVPAPAPVTPHSPDEVDVDLTVLNSTMVYAEVYNIMMSPEDYIGKVIKMNGLFYPGTDQEQTQFYPACLIQDATACCAQGIEFLLPGASYPEDYPAIGSPITVSGTFATYEEDGVLYCHLINAALV